LAGVEDDVDARTPYIYSTILKVVDFVSRTGVDSN